MNWTLVEDSAELSQVLAAHAPRQHVAVDTEFRRRDTFFPQVALVQLCWGAEAYLIDPLKLQDLTALRSFLTAQNQLKVIHSASEDLEVFSHWLGVLPAPLFDTQRAAGLLGLGAGQSYRALVAQFFDIDLPKDETQSDWLQRPLTAAQAEYAALDVTYLHPIGAQLLERATALHRLDWILEDGARMRPGGKPPLSKFKSAYRLPAAEQRALAALVAWREKEARGRDKPRSWILSDKLIMAVVRAMPESIHALADVDDMPKGLIRRAGDELLSCIQCASDESQPPVTEAILPPLSKPERGLLARVSDHLSDIAASLDVPPEILMPKADLEQLIRQHEQPTSVTPRRGPAGGTLWLSSRSSSGCVTRWRHERAGYPRR